MARTAVWILLVTVLVGYATSTTTDLATTATAGLTGTSGEMTTAGTTGNTGTPTTKPTEPKSTTTATPEPEIPTFRTTDGEGKVCMIIALNARVSTLEDDDEEQKSSVVPADASIDKAPSECPQDEKQAYIELSWATDDTDWVLGMLFEADDDTYTMTTVNGSYTTENDTVMEWSNDDFDFPQADLGHSVHCRNFKIEPNLDFEEYKFQPFAQRSDGGYGEAEECNESSGLDTIWIIVISCAGGVLLLIVLAGICAFCSKKKEQSSYEKV